MAHSRCGLALFGFTHTHTVERFVTKCGAWTGFGERIVDADRSIHMISRTMTVQTVSVRVLDMLNIEIRLLS